MKLAERSIVVTGAGSGIGRAIAIACAKEGALVTVADIDADKAKATEQDILANKGKAISCVVDVSNVNQVKTLAETTISTWGKVDALINNAAIQVNKTIADTTEEEWHRQMTVNVGGVFLCSKLFLPHLKKTRGNIVNMSSVNAYFVEASCAGYCTTKAAIVGLTKAMAIDHGREGVRVNCICPGYIDAGLAEGYFQSQKDPAKARVDAGKLHAIGRIGTAEEVARVAVFLASDDASFVTGSAYVVDGGFGSGLPPATS